MPSLHSLLIFLLGVYVGVFLKAWIYATKKAYEKRRKKRVMADEGEISRGNTT